MESFTQNETYKRDSKLRIDIVKLNFDAKTNNESKNNEICKKTNNLEIYVHLIDPNKMKESFYELILMHHHKFLRLILLMEVPIRDKKLNPNLNETLLKRKTQIEFICRWKQTIMYENENSQPFKNIIGCNFEYCKFEAFKWISIKSANHNSISSMHLFNLIPLFQEKTQSIFNFSSKKPIFLKQLTDFEVQELKSNSTNRFAQKNSAFNITFDPGNSIVLPQNNSLNSSDNIQTIKSEDNQSPLETPFTHLITLNEHNQLLLHQLQNENFESDLFIQYTQFYEYKSSHSQLRYNAFSNIMKQNILQKYPNEKQIPPLKLIEALPIQNSQPFVNDLYTSESLEFSTRFFPINSGESILYGMLNKSEEFSKIISPLEELITQFDALSTNQLRNANELLKKLFQFTQSNDPKIFPQSKSPIPRKAAYQFLWNELYDLSRVYSHTDSHQQLSKSIKSNFNTFHKIVDPKKKEEKGITRKKIFL